MLCHVGGCVGQIISASLAVCPRLAVGMSAKQFGTSASLFWHVRQFSHFGATVLPLRRVPSACRRSHITTIHFKNSLPTPTQTESRRYSLDNFGLAASARRRGSFSTSARQFATVLPLQHVPVVCRRNSVTFFHFQILYLLRAQSISAVRFYDFGAAALALRRIILQLRREPLASRRSFIFLTSKVSIYSVLKASRLYSFTTSARQFQQLGASILALWRVSCCGVSAGAYSMSAAQEV